MLRRGFTTAGARHARGFTLVELLVVIGIISVLISILLPAVSRVRASASTVVCLANLRQVGQGLVMYAGSFSGYIPPSEYDWDTWDNNVAVGGKLPGTWAGLLLATKSLQFPVAPGPTAPAVFEKNILYCPSAEPNVIEALYGWAPPGSGNRHYSDVNSTPTAEAHIDNWYVANTLGYYDPTVFGTTRPHERYPFRSYNRQAFNDGNVHLVKMSQVKRSSEVVAVYEGRGVHYDQPQNSMLPYRHPNATVNMVFLDGSARSVSFARIAKTTIPEHLQRMWNDDFHQHVREVSGVRFRIDIP
jgi:prepilin-type N-terminal cleavage/methylation domain-containing protein/prepilin-type processing-associated H-X9-DG protein